MKYEACKTLHHICNVLPALPWQQHLSEHLQAHCNVNPLFQQPNNLLPRTRDAKILIFPSYGVLISRYKENAGNHVNQTDFKEI